MKLLDSLRSIKPLEIFALIIFILFVILPVKVPTAFSGWFDSPIGILFLFIVTIVLFTYTNPILGVIFILVAYELIRRSSVLSGKPIGQMIYANNMSQSAKDTELQHLNTPTSHTLEEEVVKKMAPASQDFIQINNSDFKPIMEPIVGASLI
jgi:predicted membrane protein